MPASASSASVRTANRRSWPDPQTAYIPFDGGFHSPTLPALFPNLPRPVMTEIQIRKGEPVDRALKRLKTRLEMDGILEEVRRLRAHETPKERTKRKARAAAKRGKIRYRFTLPKAPGAPDAPPSA